MIWAGAAAIVAALVLVGLGFAAFWPAWPPLDDTPIPTWMRDENTTEARHRADPKRRGLKRVRRAAVLDENLEEPPAPQEPTRMAPEADSWMWNTEGGQTERRRMPAPPPAPTPRPEAYHRWEHLGEGTQPLHPRDLPEEDGERTQVIRPRNPPPAWPPDNRIK